MAVGDALFWDQTRIPVDNQHFATHNAFGGVVKFNPEKTSATLLDLSGGTLKLARAGLMKKDSKHTAQSSEIASKIGFDI